LKNEFTNETQNNCWFDWETNPFTISCINLQYVAKNQWDHPMDGNDIQWMMIQCVKGSSIGPMHANGYVHT